VTSPELTNWVLALGSRATTAVLVLPVMKVLTVPLLAIKAEKDSATKLFEMVLMRLESDSALAFLAASSVTIAWLTAKALSAAY
jgi:hypothetical protein